MKNKKIVFLIVIILLINFLTIPSTHSRLNITYTQDMAIFSNTYEPLTIVSTRKLEENSYEISLKNDNNYEVAFSCEDIYSNFNITCSTNTITAKNTKNITVDLDFKEDVDKSTLTPNPNGIGYITKLGIRITSPYFYPITNPHYVTSDNMVVVELTMTNLLNHVKSLANTDTTNLARDHTVNVRYIGTNPNNYIYFNDELWRILGVVDGKLKIISTTPYNNTPNTFYDGSVSGTNTKFQNSTLKTELNETFYYRIKSKYRSMLVEGNWNVGGINIWNWQNAVTAYTTEKETTIQANVGLISATDYAYAIGGSNRTTCIESSHIGNVNSCNSDNWLYSYATTSGMWTINEFTGENGYTLVVNTDGNIAPNGIQYTSAAYPVIYLDETVVFISGDGTETNPYRIRGGSKPVISNNYTDYILNVYVNSWGNELSGYVGREITSFDKEGGALMFSNDTWGISDEYTIYQVVVYDYNDLKEAKTYYTNAGWTNNNGIYHERPSNYLFRRHLSPDLDYIGKDTIEKNNGTLGFVIIVKPK